MPPLSLDKLDKIAMTAMRGGAMLMESGARAHVVHEFVEVATKAMGAEFLGFRLGYASMAITVGDGEHSATRMIGYATPGANFRLDAEVRALARKVERAGMDVDLFAQELNRIRRETPKYPAVVTSLAVGLACAGFCALLKGDGAALAAVLLASSIGQFLRHQMRHQGINLFVTAALVAFFSSLTGGMVAQLLGSHSVNLAAVASTLLLVPGVPATNAQTDIIDGYPTLGSARAVTVLMIMIFVTTGIWMAGFLLGLRV